jgi:hypothetical protein
LNGSAPAQIHAIAYRRLEDLKRRSDPNSPLDAYLMHRVQQFQSDPAKFIAAKPIEAPPGMHSSESCA